MPTAFAVQLVQRLRDQDPVVTPALRWLEERLAAQGTTADEIVRVEHQRQAAMNVTVRNVITSMRLMSAFDWAEFFESVSLVDAILRADTILPRWTLPPAIVTDTRSRNWRGAHSTRNLRSPNGRCSKRNAVRAEAPGSQRLPGDRQADPGYYLISQGRVAFEQELGFRVPIKRWLRRAYLTEATPAIPRHHRDRQRTHPRCVPLECQ